LRRARVQNGVSPEMSRQVPRGREVRTPDRVERTGAAARNTRREDLVVRIVVERPRERGSVKGVVDRTPQSSIAKQGAPGVEDEIVDQRQRLAEVPLRVDPGGGARRSITLVEHASR